MQYRRTLEPEEKEIRWSRRCRWVGGVVDGSREEDVTFMHWGSCTGQYMERFMSVGKFAHEHGYPPVARMRPGAVHVPAYQDRPISSSSVHAASPSTTSTTPTTSTSPNGTYTLFD